MTLYQSKGKILVQLLLGFFLLAMVGGAIYSTYTGPRVDPGEDPRKWLFLGIGPIAFLLLIGMQVFWIRRLIDRKPALQVDEKGIDTGHARYGFFSWQELANIFLIERQVGITRKVHMLLLIPRDPQATLTRYSGYTLKRAQTSMKQNQGLMILMQTLPGNTQELAGAIAEYGQQQIVANPVMPPVVPAMEMAPPKI